MTKKRNLAQALNLMRIYSLRLWDWEEPAYLTVVISTSFQKLSVGGEAHLPLQGHLLHHFYLKQNLNSSTQTRADPGEERKLILMGLPGQGT